MNKIFLTLFLAIVTLFSFGCQSNNESEGSSSENSATISESYGAPDINMENVDIIKESLNKGFGAINNISFSESSLTFHLTPIAGLTETDALEKIANNPKAEEHQNTLKALASSCIEFSQIVSDNVGKGYSIQLDNPSNNKKPFFIVKDGNVEYPVMN